MTLKEFILEYGTDRAREVAEAAGTNYAYLSQVAYGHRKAGPQLTRKISDATGGEVALHELRPDVYPPEAA